MHNQAEIIGYLGAAPESSATAASDAVSNFSVATTDRWRDKQTNETKERTEWHRVVVFGRLAETCNLYLKKGSLVFISGPMQTRKWVDNQGHNRYTTEVKAMTMKMLDRVSDTVPQTSPQPTSLTIQETPLNPQEEPQDDIPF